MSSSQGCVTSGPTATVIEPVFDTHSEYEKLLAGAHRRRVTPLGAPALVRHIAFWNPAPGTSTEPQAPSAEPNRLNGSGSPESSDEPTTIFERSRAADAALSEVYRTLQRKVSNPRGKANISSLATNSDIPLPAGRRGIVLFASVIDSETGVTTDTPANCRPDSYRAIKIMFIWHGLPVTLSFELHTEFLALTSVIDVSSQKTAAKLAKDRRAYGKAFNEVIDKFMCFANIGTAPSGQCGEIHRYMYHSVWSQFSKEILLSLKNHSKALGPKFVDFRGITLGATGPKGAVRISKPFSRNPNAKGTGKERKPVCSIHEFDELWNFLTCTQSRDTEFTLSRFLEGRAFYATALGSQSQTIFRTNPKPLYYLLYEDTLNPWQLGRLIYRIHRAGAARIAAIIHFDELRKANQILTEIEGQLENSIAELSNDGEGENNDALRLSMRELYKRVESKMGQIARLDLDGTLESRIERSRYYVNQFSIAAQSLRINRVKGFQQYDEFVIQRLGPVFDYIDSLGRKYTRIQADRLLLLNRVQTLDSLHNEHQIYDAQRIADIALSCVLAPYYVGYVIAHSVSGLLDERLVWLTALWFGIIMLVILQYAWPLSRLFGGAIRNLFLKRTLRFLLAFGLAIFGTTFTVLGLETTGLILRNTGPPSGEAVANVSDKQPAR